MSRPWMLTSRGLYNLALARARAETAGFPVFDDEPKEIPSGSGYAILDPGAGREAVTRGHGVTTSSPGRFHIRCYGTSRAQAAFVFDAMVEAFRDWRPYPDRRRFGAVEQEDADWLGIDRSVPTKPRAQFLLTYHLPDY